MSFGKHLAAIRSGLVSKTNVIGIRKACNAANRRAAGYSVSCTAPKVTASEVWAALDLIRELRPRVDAALHASGAAILNSKRYAKRWGAHERAVIAGLSHFELAGFDCLPSPNDLQVSPVYRAVAKDGASFRFWNIAWQSGGDGPEVITWA